jgi:murein DD-endopeptidase MepM/ murein hydrolase activator NlpD
MKWATGQTKDKFGCTRRDGAGNKKFHAGIDLDANVGTECFATEAGTINIVRTGVSDGDSSKALGNYVGVEFKKAGKTYGAGYCHLKTVSVSRGASVTAGQSLGTTGISGNASVSNPHLHLEIHDKAWRPYATASERAKHTLDPNDYV